MKEIAVFGGTFDPPTSAHEEIIGACLERPEIDEVWLMPSGCRTDKPDMAPDATRLAMLGLVREVGFRGHERLVVTDFEQQLPQPTQTHRTVGALETAYPDHSFWFVYGADAYQSMPEWENGTELQRTLGMLLVSRPRYERPPETGNIRHLAVDLSDEHVSSTTFREACQADGPVESMVNPAVLHYIHERALYASEAAAGNI